jgi:hypothetical protein
MAVLYGTDAGSGTLSQLDDGQLTLALAAGSNRVTVYAGAVYDDVGTIGGTNPAPAIFHDLTLDLAAFWATKTYLKNQAMGPTHPVWLAYTEAMKLLEAARKGEISLAIGEGAGAAASARIINRIPPVFSRDDSNTTLNRGTGYLEAGTPSELGGSRSVLDGWDDPVW